MALIFVASYVALDVACFQDRWKVSWGVFVLRDQNFGSEDVPADYLF